MAKAAEAGRPAAVAAKRRAAARIRRIVIISAQFNESITQALVEGAHDELDRAGVARGRIEVLWVPGAFELPVTAACVARRRKPEAIIALGCIIKGETSQYLTLAHAVAQGLTHVAVETGIPVTSGVIVAETVAQAEARAGGAVANRGREAALAALAVLDVVHGLKNRTTAE